MNTQIREALADLRGSVEAQYQSASTLDILREMVGRLQSSIGVKSIMQCYIAVEIADEISASSRDISSSELIRETNNVLTSADVPGNRSTEIAHFGAQIIPFARDFEIDIDDLLVPGYWSRLVAARAALKKMCDANDVEGVSECVDFIRDSRTRAEVRERYQNKRAWIGTGKLIELADKCVLVVNLEEGVTRDTLASRISGAIRISHDLDVMTTLVACVKKEAEVSTDTVYRDKEVE